MPTVVESEKSPSAWAPPAATPLDEAVWQAWVSRGRAHDRRSSAARMKALKWASIAALAAAGIFLVSGVMSAATLTRDLSKYRKFELGTDLSTVAGLMGANPSQAKVIHSRPALIQELEWRPQPLGSSSQSEPAQAVLFSFYDGKLFRIAVTYDRYGTEGLTADDLVGAISATYGPAAKPTDADRIAPAPYGDQQEILAQWQDSQYRFDLIRFSYGPTFRLVGVMKRLDAPAQAATLEAMRLDDQEAPQRDAARIASEEQTAKAKLEKARLVNKPNFRP